MRAVAVIQARMNSTRLPGKVLLPLAGQPLLFRLVERIASSRRLSGLVVATTDTPADDPVASLCRDRGIDCHRGSETDVLGRLLDAARDRGAEVMVRLTADNPFVDGLLVDAVLALLEADGSVDYAHSVDGTGFPYGLFVEAVRVAALDVAAAVADASEREHVTLYLRRHPDRFTIRALPAPGRFGRARFTVDTAEDYGNLRPLFEEMYAADPAFSHRALMAAQPMQAPGAGRRA